MKMRDLVGPLIYRDPVACLPPASGVPWPLSLPRIGLPKLFKNFIDLSSAVPIGAVDLGFNLTPPPEFQQSAKTKVAIEK